MLSRRRKHRAINVHIGTMEGGKPSSVVAEVFRKIRREKAASEKPERAA